jgi:hypothetical protein
MLSGGGVRVICAPPYESAPQSLDLHRSTGSVAELVVQHFCIFQAECHEWLHAALAYVVRNCVLKIAGGNQELKRKLAMLSHLRERTTTYQ